MVLATEEKKTAVERSDEHANKVAAVVIEQLRNCTSPWQRPWENSKSGFPTNALTGKAYRGSNAMFLWATGIQKGYTDGRWITFRQATELGAKVRKGEHGTQICYPATHYEVVKRDGAGKPVLDTDGRPEKVYIKYDRPLMKYYTVFAAAEQCDAMPPAPIRVPMHEWERHERAEAILEGCDARITHGGNRAYYLPGLDYITLPHKEQFASADRYYATALHELGHWTGHPDRLNRDLSGKFGSASYAKEELCAEIASLMVGQSLEIGHDPDQHAAYVQDWIKILSDDPKEILRACSDAAKIQDYVLQYDRGIEQQRAQEIRAEDERTTESLKVSSWEVGVLDGACIGNLPNGTAIETWGDTLPTLAIRDTRTQTRVALKFLERSSEWDALATAVRAGDPYEARVDALVRHGTALDKNVSTQVTVGRSINGGILVSLRPEDPQYQSFAIVFDREDAAKVSRAMEIANHHERRAFVATLTHHTLKENIYVYQR